MTDQLRLILKPLVELLADSGHLDRMKFDHWGRTYNIPPESVQELVNEIIRERSKDTSYQSMEGK